MHQKRGQRLLRSISGTTILGEGMLERMRATSLGLLGATAAVGLAIVALVFNQAWPLVAGTPAPAPPVLEIGKAKVVAGAGDRRPRVAAADSPGSPRRGSTGSESADRAGAPVSSLESPPAPASELVVAPSTPAPAPASPKSGGGSSPEPSPAQPEGSSPPAQPRPAAQTPPAPPPEAGRPESPPATVSEAPTDSYVPSWSNGKGHAYGRSGESTGNGHDE